MSSQVLEVEELQVDLRPGANSPPTQVVRGVSFELSAGKRLGLVGESGCGKTTTLMAIAGLLAPTASVAGEVQVCGTHQFTPARGAPPALRNREVGIIFQASMNALNPVRRIGHQLREALREGVRSDRAEAQRRCDELLERVGLSKDVARSYPHQLSGGMRQRVCIAMALAGEPRLLLADEPTTALDTVVQARIVELLDELCADLKLSVVIVSHDLRLAADFCDSIAVMYAGSIIEYGTSAQLVSNPQHPYTRLLFAATPTIESTADEIKSIPGAPPDLTKEIVGCPFRSRCPDASEVCGTPPPRVPNATGFAACHYASR
jgi:peptide/nickel transport system ATP-binding protein